MLLRRSLLGTCPACSRLVNLSVNGYRCPYCGDRTFHGPGTTESP